MQDGLTPRARLRLSKSGNRYGCPTCGKRRFLTKAEAKRRARQVHPGKHLSVFRCGDFWHYGHLDPEVVDGRRTRDGRIHPDLAPQPNPAVAATMRAIWDAPRRTQPEQEAAS